MGFSVYKRTDEGKQRRLYLLIYMRLADVEKEKNGQDLENIKKKLSSMMGLRASFCFIGFSHLCTGSGNRPWRTLQGLWRLGW